MRNVGLNNLARLALALEMDLGAMLEGLQAFPGRAGDDSTP
jgi:hypothetical protein